MPRRHHIAILAVITVAGLFRLYNLGYDSMAHDEAGRANWSHHGGFDEARRLPPLSFLMLRGIQQVVGRGEVVLRLPYALAGIACVLLLYQLSRRHIDEGSAFLVAMVAACHPVLVHFSRMLKVFSLEALACALLMWAGMEAYRRRTHRQLLLFAGAAVVSIGFTYTGALVAAAWMPVLAWSSLRRNDGQQRPVWSFAVAVCLFGLAAGGCHYWFAGAASMPAVTDYFGEQENAWPTAYSPAVLAAWLAVNTRGAAQYVLGITNDWPPLSWCVAAVELLAISMSIGVMWKRCRPLCVALMILALEVVLVGVLRMWPFGKFRTMTFLVPLVSIAVGCGLWRFVRTMGWSPATLVMIGLCLGVPASRAAQSTLISPRVTEHIRPVIAHIRSNLRPGDALFVYYGAQVAFEYYGDFDDFLRHPSDTESPGFVHVRWGNADMPVQVQPVCERQNLPGFADRFDAWIRQHPRVWFLFAHNWQNERQEWVAYLEDRYELIDRIDSKNASAHLFAAKNPHSSCRKRPRIEAPGQGAFHYGRALRLGGNRAPDWLARRRQSADHLAIRGHLH